MPESEGMNSSFPCKSWRNFFLQDNNPCRGIFLSKTTNGSLPQRDSLFTFGIPQPGFSHKATLDNLIRIRQSISHSPGVRRAVLFFKKCEFLDIIDEWPFFFLSCKKIGISPARSRDATFSSKKIIKNLPGDRQMIPQRSQ